MNKKDIIDQLRPLLTWDDYRYAPMIEKIKKIVDDYDAEQNWVHSHDHPCKDIYCPFCYEQIL